VSQNHDEPPFEGGSQPVRDTPPEVAGPGRSVMQGVVIGIGVLAVLGMLLWFLIPILQSSR